jgi:outer membrane receptor protein involved in Fe transport
VDARIGYSFEAWGSDLNAFLSINNVFNRDPVPFITAPDAGLTQAVGNGVVGDLRGRRYVVGVNFAF